MRRLVLAAVVTALVAPLLTAPATAVEPALEQGTLLPQRPLGYSLVAQIGSAHGDHLILNYPSPPQPGELATGEGTFDLYRLSDGAVLRRDVAGGELESRYLPRLGATSLYQVERPGTGDTTTTVVWREIESGAVLATLSVLSDELVSTDDTGLLLQRAGGREMWFVDRDGGQRRVQGLPTQTWHVVGAGVGSVLVRQGFTTYEVDRITATATVFLEGVLPPDLLTVSGRTYWSEVVYGTGKRLHWLDRRDGSTGALQTSTYAPLVPFGDRLAAYQYAPDSGGSYELRPIDLSTGASEPALGRFQEYRPLADGTAVAVDPTGSGRVVVLHDGPPRVVEGFALPEVAQDASSVALTTTAVVAGWSRYRYVGDPSVDELTAIEPGQDAWTTLPGDLAASELLGASGEVVLTRGYEADGSRWTRATWPGGSRALAPAEQPVRLGREGMLYRLDGSDEVRDVRTGAVVHRLPAATGASLDGSWVWTRDDRGVLQGVDTSGAAPPRAVPSGVACAGGAQVRLRFAVVHCDDEHSSVYAVDLAGALPPVRIPAAPEDCFPWWRCERHVQLGDGFVVWEDTESPLGTVISVADLSGSGVVRAYGHGDEPAIGDGTSGRFAYRGPGGVRVVDLGWLGEAPAPRVDIEPPVVAPLSGSAPTGTGARFAVAWSGTDPEVAGGRASGLASYDVRHQQSPAAGAPFGPWVEPAAWTGTTQMSVELDVAPGSTTCVQVRARDAAGNVSAWTASRCYTRASTAATALVLAGDLTGDGQSDLLTRDETGTLWLHRGELLSTFAPPTPVSSGWRGLTALVAPGDVTGDRRPDLLGRDSSGRMWLYPGTGDGRLGAARNVSSGWRGLTAIVGPGDVTGDRRADLLGRDSSGRLYLWAGTGTGAFGAPRGVSGGWNAFPTLVAPGDVTQDGRADLLGRDTAGRMWRWDGVGNGTFRAPQQVSTGWGRYGLLTGGPDYAGDPYPDLVGLDASYRLTRWMGDEGGRFLAPTTGRPVH